jgi:F420-non-reducing hydrogenase small subunit
MCIKGQMPCSGCYGPTSRVRDGGAKLLSAIAASADATDDAKIEEILSGIPDPIGTFYRYGLAASMLKRKVADKGGK